MILDGSNLGRREWGEATVEDGSFVELAGEEATVEELDFEG